MQIQILKQTRSVPYDEYDRLLGAVGPFSDINVGTSVRQTWNESPYTSHVVQTLFIMGYVMDRRLPWYMIETLCHLIRNACIKKRPRIALKEDNSQIFNY